MYDIKKATPIYKELIIIGYIYPLTDELWLPLTPTGEPCGPPSYKDDAKHIVTRSKND